MPQAAELISPPDPKWTGFADYQEADCVPGLLAVVQKAAAEKQQSLHDDVAKQRKNLQYYANEMTEIRRRMAATEAEIRALEAHDFAADEQSILKDVEYIKQLPGVLGIRVNDGKMVVYIRTTAIYNEKLYDMGDYELTLSPSGDDSVINVFCTRMGTRKNDAGNHHSHPYFHHGEVSADGSATGWFCFGNRTTQLRKLLAKGAYGEFVHLAINTISSVTSGEESYYYGSYFAEIPFTLKEQLRRRKAFREANPPFRPKLP